MKPPTDPSPFPTLGDARQYLEAAGIGDFFARGGSIALANALYRLIGPDPDRARTAIRLLDIAEAAAALDFDTVPDPPQGGEQRPFLVALVDADAVVHKGSLEGAELWLRREAEARAEAEGGGP